MNEFHQFILNSALDAIRQDNEKNIIDVTSISETSKRAQRIATAWQTQCQKKYNFLLICSDKTNIMHFGILDAKQGTVYESRVSTKNPHNHFFKTMCKIIAYNWMCTQKKSCVKIKTVNYLVLPQVEKELINGIPRSVMEALMETNGVNVNIIPMIS